MTTVPGTHFTKEQLEADRKGKNYYLTLISKRANTLVHKADKVTAKWGYFGSDKLIQYGYIYGTERKQLDKSLAWYILAAMENNSWAQNNIGLLYRNGEGVPTNYLCAMKWYLKAVEQNNPKTPNKIGKLFENGYGVTRDKHGICRCYCDIRSGKCSTL
ncbi:hypothetical protein K501DRAFT_301373 [Backusella circina FSU 941]|nr:hypothetical protein K501DRAFT_301373 [Backusella circina FSU 941]